MADTLRRLAQMLRRGGINLGALPRGFGGGGGQPPEGAPDRKPAHLADRDLPVDKYPRTRENWLAWEKATRVSVLRARTRARAGCVD